MDQKQKIEEDKELMLQMLQEEKLLRDQQEEKISRLTQLILSAPKKTPIESNPVAEKKVFLNLTRITNVSHQFIVLKKKIMNRRETWCVGASQSAAFLGEINGLGAIIPTYEQTRREGKSAGADDESEFPDFRSLDPIGSMHADKLFPSFLSKPSHSASGFITSRGKEAGQSLPHAAIKRFVDSESEQIVSREQMQADVETTQKLLAAEQQIEEVCIAFINIVILFYSYKQLQRIQADLEAQLQAEREQKASQPTTGIELMFLMMQIINVFSKITKSC